MSAARTLEVMPGFLTEKQTGMRLPIGEEMILGRETGLAANGISRKHCAIKPFHGHFYIVDLHSRYGTLVNGKPIKPNNWHLLSSGDRISIGPIEYIVEYESASAPISLKDLKIPKEIEQNFDKLFSKYYPLIVWRLLEVRRAILFLIEKWRTQ